MILLPCLLACTVDIYYIIYIQVEAYSISFFCLGINNIVLVSLKKNLCPEFLIPESIVYHFMTINNVCAFES